MTNQTDLQKVQASAQQLPDNLKAVLATGTPLLGLVALPLIAATIRNTISIAAAELGGQAK